MFFSCSPPRLKSKTNFLLCDVGIENKSLCILSIYSITKLYPVLDASDWKHWILQVMLKIARYRNLWENSSFISDTALAYGIHELHNPNPNPSAEPVCWKQVEWRQRAAVCWDSPVQAAMPSRPPYGGEMQVLSSLLILAKALHLWPAKAAMSHYSHTTACF